MVTFAISFADEFLVNFTKTCARGGAEKVGVENTRVDEV